MQTREQLAWSVGKPVSGILPEKGYQDNCVIQWLLEYPDAELTKWQQLLSTFHSALDPATCQEGYLDYVAFLFGLSRSPYWVKDWSTPIKRAILANQAYLKKFRGTLDAIKKVLTIQGITYAYYQDAPLLIPFKLPGLFGAGKMRILILMPSLTSRTGREWREARRTLKGYSPAVVESKVAYQGFIFGRSVLGDPIFPSGSTFVNTKPDGSTFSVTI
jgi:hypothetical protein